ncbi:Mobile element protein [Azospirillum doebereinerae]
MPRPTFDILLDEGALPVAVPRSAEGHLAEKGTDLDRIVAEVADLAGKGLLEDVDLSDGELRVTSIRDTTLSEAEELGRRAYDLMPRMPCCMDAVGVVGHAPVSDLAARYAAQGQCRSSPSHSANEAHRDELVRV